jgi:uncharacterized membrane-anchored protein
MSGLALAMSFAWPLAAGAAEQEQPAKNESPFAKLAWQKGPTQVALGSRADVALAEHQAALPEADSGKFLELTGNLPSPGTQIVVGGSWWATFEFDDSGYVKDDEKIDADALLKQIKDSDGPSNEERRKRGMAELTTDGWYMPPHYDSRSRQLEWALKLHASDDPKPVINYTVRLLGRSGYERAVLVSSPETLDKDVAEFKQMLTAFNFHTGEKYSEFRQGDRVAEFGLAALVAGGAAAVAVKTGFWKAILAFLVAGWKLVAAAVVAGFAAIGKLFKRKSGSA